MYQIKPLQFFFSAFQHTIDINMWQLISDIRLNVPKTYKTAQKMIGFNCPSFEQFVVSLKGDAVCSSVIMSIIVGKKCQAPVGMWSSQFTL